MHASYDVIMDEETQNGMLLHFPNFLYEIELNSSDINLQDIIIERMKQLQSSSTLAVQMCIRILKDLPDPELLAVSKVNKLFCKIAFLCFMNRGLKFTHQRVL